MAKNIDQTNLSKIATSGSTLDAFDAEITLGELMELFNNRYPHEFMDSVAVNVVDQYGYEIFYCDCMDADGDCDDHLEDQVLAIEFNEDWYSDGSEKKGYVVTLK